MPSADFDVVTGPPAPGRPVAPAAGPSQSPPAGEDLPAALPPAPLAGAIADAATGENR